MKKLLFCASLAAVMLYQTGCQQFGESEAQQQAAQNRMLQKQREQQRMNELRQNLAHSRETAKYYEEELAKLSGRLNNMQTDYSNVVNKLNELQKRLLKNQQENQIIEKEITGLKNEIATEREARKQDINKMLEQVSKQTADAINKIAKIAQANQAASSSSSNSTQGPPTDGKYVVHTVGKGQTLSAIATAYKVTVPEIKKANRMKNDMIRVGQQLYIPKK